MSDDINLEHEIEVLISRSPQGHATRVLPAELEFELSFAFRRLARRNLVIAADASASFQPDEFRDRLRARMAAITDDCMRLFDRLMQGVATEGGSSGLGNSCLNLRGWIESEIKEAIGTKIEDLTHVRRQQPVHPLSVQHPQSAALPIGRTEECATAGGESSILAPPHESLFADTGIPKGKTATVQQSSGDHRSAGDKTAALVANSKTTQQEGFRPRPGRERKGDAALLVGNAVTFRTAEQYLGITERHRQNLVKDLLLTVEGRGHNKKITTASLRKYLPPEIPN